MIFVWTLQDAIALGFVAMLGCAFLGFVLYAALRQAIRSIRKGVIGMAAPKKKGGGGC